MPRVHTVKKSMKAYPGTGIEKGDTYYWWEFRYGGLHRSKTYPKPAQLTNSPFLQGMYGAQETQQNLVADDSLEQAVQDLAQELRDLGEQAQESFDNMPEGLQQGDTGQMLEGRVTAMEEAADALEGIDFSGPPEKGDEDPDETDEEFQERLTDWYEERLTEAQEVDINEGG